MEAKPIWATLALCALFLGWLYVELKFERQINYQAYDYLINSTTGALMKPKDLLEVEKVLGAPKWYVNETNSLERLHDLEYGVHLGTGLESDRLYSSASDLALSGWPAANGTLCGEQLAWIRHKLSTASEQHHSLIRGQLGLELTQLIDSFGKPEAGLFAGATSWPGAYGRCLKTSIDEGRIKTRYCWLWMRPNEWPRHEPVRPQARIRMGVCLPESCDTQAFDEQLASIEWLAKLDLSEFHQRHLVADSMFCLPDERSPIRQLPLSGRLFLVLVFIWFALIIISSLAYEKLARVSQVNWRHQSAAAESSAPVKSVQLKLETALESGQQQTSGVSLNRAGPIELLRAMSLRNSLESFLANPFAEANSHRDEFRLDLSSLNAVKVMMSVIVVLGHCAYLTGRFLRINSNKLHVGTQTTGLIIMSLGRFVDTFFLLFGLFAAYTLLRKTPAKKLGSPTTWLGFNLHVFLRLMPLIMPIYFYGLLVSVYTSHGPWWDYGTYEWTLKGHCRNDPWWKVIPIFGFLGPWPGVTCLPVNWFLVVYSQISLLLPLLVFCLHKLPNQLARSALIVYIAAISSALIVTKMSRQTTFREASFGYYGALLVDLMEKFESLGAMSSVGRAGCIVIGCYVGYLLRMYELGNIQRWPKWFTSKATLVVVVALNLFLLLLAAIGGKITQLTGHKTSLNEFIGGFLITGYIWALLNSLLIVMVVTIYNQTTIVRFFGNSFWHSANKLGFGIFLVHFEVIYSTLLGHEEGPSLGFEDNIWQLFTYALSISTLLAFVLYLFIEAPVNALVGLILQKISNGQSAASSNGPRRLPGAEVQTREVSNGAGKLPL